MAKTNTQITIDGIEYSSCSEAARAIYKNGEVTSPTAIAKIINNNGGKITPQTVGAQTVYLDKVKSRRTKYQVIRLAKTKKYSTGMIAEKVGMKTISVVNFLKKNDISVPKKEELVNVSKVNKTKVAKVKKTKVETPVVETVES